MVRPRASCDACYLRKTKCIWAGGRSEEACTYCQETGLQCSRTAHISLGQGDVKRQKLDLQYATSSLPLLQSTVPLYRDDDVRHRQVDDIHPVLDGIDHTPIHAQSSSTSTTTTTEPNETRSAARLLGVAGLSRKALDECLDAFFKYLGVWMMLNDDQVRFRKRTHILLNHLAGFDDASDAPRETAATSGDTDGVGKEDTKNVDSKPACELLVLAVATRGCVYSRCTHLLPHFMRRIESLLRNVDNVLAEGLDAMEAIALISEHATRPLHSRLPGRKEQYSVHFDPLGKGFAAEICLFTGLNKVVPPSDPFFRRKQFLFWIIYCHDAIRSASAGIMYRISDDDVGWSYPGEKPSDFPYIQMSNLARRLCRTFFSARSMGSKLSPTELMHTLAAVTEFPSLVGLSLDMVSTPTSLDDTPKSANSAVEGSRRQKSSSISSANDNQYEPKGPALAQSVQHAVLLGLWLRLCLTLWIEVKKSALTPYCEEVIRVDEFAENAALQACQLAKACNERKLMEYAPNVLLTNNCAWCLYYLHQMKRVQGLSPASQGTQSSSMRNLQSQAATLLQSIRSSTRSYHDPQGLADALESRIQTLAEVEMTEIARVAERYWQPLQREPYDTDDGEAPGSLSRRGESQTPLLPPHIQSPAGPHSQEERIVPPIEANAGRHQQHNGLDDAVANYSSTSTDWTQPSISDPSLTWDADLVSLFLENGIELPPDR